MHGVGAETTRAVFAAAGLAAPHARRRSRTPPTPRFPTVAFPNPEEPGAIDLLMALAARVGADVAIAEDPDADRCSVVCGGRQLTGDEVGRAARRLAAAPRGARARTRRRWSAAR